jgi:hypothetical protein
MSWLCKTLELATIPCAMPQLAWTTNVHQDSILRLRTLISSSLDLALRLRGLLRPTEP